MFYRTVPRFAPSDFVIRRARISTRVVISSPESPFFGAQISSISLITPNLLPSSEFYVGKRKYHHPLKSCLSKIYHLTRYTLSKLSKPDFALISFGQAFNEEIINAKNIVFKYVQYKAKWV
jgi:hypothetical protein